MQIHKLITPYNFTNHYGCDRIKYIVIHYVGALGGAKACCNYYASQYVGASAHYYVDHDGTVWQSVEDEDIAWSVGAKSYKHPDARNANTLNIEMCVRKRNTSTLNATDRDWYFTDETVISTIQLTKMKMAEYNIPIDRVIRHYDVTGKICPNPFVYDNGNYSWAKFKSLLTGGGGGSIETPTWKPTAIGICTGDSVNVRKSPNGTVVGKLNKGNEFELDGQKSNEWTHVKVAGIGVAWVHSNYVKIKETVSTGNKVPLKYTVLTVTADTLNVRTSPTTSGNNIIGQLKKGNRLNCDARQWNEGTCWFHYGDGWVSGKYLTGWVYDYNVRKYWYLDPGYEYPVSEWRWIDGKSYYFDKNGWMLYDCYVVYGDHYCYLDPKGAWVKERDTKNPDRSKYKVYGTVQ